MVLSTDALNSINMSTVNDTTSTTDPDATTWTDYASSSLHGSCTMDRAYDVSTAYSSPISTSVRVLQTPPFADQSLLWDAQTPSSTTLLTYHILIHPVQLRNPPNSPSCFSQTLAFTKFHSSVSSNDDPPACGLSLNFTWTRELKETGSASA